MRKEKTGVKSSGELGPRKTPPVECARMWPRAVFDYLVGKRTFARTDEIAALLERPGVYVLYRDDRPYYIGQARNLRTRLWHHANVHGSAYNLLWNYFSVFIENNSQRRNQIEGILIAAMPTANGAKPKLVKQIYPRELRDLVRRIRREGLKGAEAP